MVSWASHKHPIAADSSCYAEYISLHNASHEVVFLWQLLEGLQMLQVNATPLYCDNDASRQLTEDQHWHAKVHHFRVKYYFTRELVDFNELNVIDIRSCNNTADILTKPLSKALFEHFCGYLGLSPPRETWGGVGVGGAISITYLQPHITLSYYFLPTLLSIVYHFATLLFASCDPMLSRRSVDTYTMM